MMWVCFSCGELNGIYPTGGGLVDYKEMEKIHKLEDDGKSVDTTCLHCNKSRIDNIYDQKMTEL